VCLLRGTDWIFIIHTALCFQRRLNPRKLPLACHEFQRTLTLAKCHSFIIHMPCSAGYLTVQQPSNKSLIVRYLTFTAALLRTPIAFFNDVTLCRWKSSSGRFERLVLPSFSEWLWKWRQYYPSKVWELFIQRSVVASQNTQISSHFVVTQSTFDGNKCEGKQRLVEKSGNAVKPFDP